MRSRDNAIHGYVMSKKSNRSEKPQEGEFIGKMILPQFRRRPEEAAIIGRILAGYGDLEFFLYICVSESINDSDVALGVLYRARGESQRIEIADAILHPIFESASLFPAYKDARDALHHCRAIRNQYAHCQWHSDTSQGLFFCNLDEAAQHRGRNIPLKFVHVDATLLADQEEYFAYAQAMLAYCTNSLMKKKQNPEATKFLKPKGRPKPLLHNKIDLPTPPKLDVGEI